MKITYDNLIKMFPRKQGNCAVFGPIPIEFFNTHEKEIRKFKLTRIIYRGPRDFKLYNFSTYQVRSYASMTRRENATHAMVY